MIAARTILLVVLFAAIAGNAQSETIAWGSRFEIVVPVDQEQEIIIQPPANIAIGIPSALSGKIDFLNVPGRLVMTAKQAFAPHNVIVKHKKYGSTVIKIAAKHGVDAKPYTLTFPQIKVSNNTASHLPSEGCQYTHAAVVRWVMQNLYAPKRILSHQDCFHPVAVNDTAINLFSCENSYLCGGGAMVTPLASWSAQADLWVHALTIKNNTPHKVALDPRDILYSEDFIAIAFAHSWLDPVGKAADNTIAILVTKDKLQSSITDFHRSSAEVSQ